MKREITIRMPKPLLRKWLKALRGAPMFNGKPFKQGKNKLFNPATKEFCCLGVLEYVASGGNVDIGWDGDFCELPKRKTLEHFGISFFSKRGLTDNAPWLPSLDDCAATANDKGISFAQLADAIEQHAVGT